MTALRRRTFLLFCGLLLGSAVPLFPVDSVEFTRYRVPLKLEFGEVYPIELTGDGKEELVLVEFDRAQRDPQAFVTVYEQSRRGFHAMPDAGAALPPRLSMAGVGRFPFGPGLALLMPGRLEIWPWREGAFRPSQAVAMAVESIFVAPGGELKSGLEWIVDLDGDGVSEIVVPQLSGLQILRFSSEGVLERHTRLLTRPHSRLWFYLSQNFVAYKLPVITFLDANGSGWKEVVAFANGLVQIFSLGPQPRPHGQLPDMEWDLQPPKPLDPLQPRDPPLRLKLADDLNGDGLLDLVFTKTTGTDSSMKTNTRILIYFGRMEGESKKLQLGPKADQVFASEGFTHPIMVDINGDGLRDLALVNVEIGFWNAIKALIARSVSAETAFYLMPETGRYPIQPDDVVEYSVNFSLGRFSHQPLALFGDLNGDGRPDLLLSANKENLGIHWGVEDGFWDSSLDVSLEEFLPISAKGVRVRDLDGDGRDDLIFLYNRNDIRQMPEINHKFTVLMSRFAFPKDKVANSP